MVARKLQAPHNRSRRLTFVVSPATSFWNRTEGDAEVAPEVMEYPTEPSVGGREKLELLVIVLVHGDLPSPPILFLSCGADMCHRSPTSGVGGWIFKWSCS